MGTASPLRGMRVETQTGVGLPLGGPGTNPLRDFMDNFRMLLATDKEIRERRRRMHTLWARPAGARDKAEREGSR